MSFLSYITTLLGALALLVSAIAFFRAKDVFTMTHVVMAANCYAVSLILIGLEIEKFSWISLTKIVVLIFLNIVITILLCHATLRRAMINKITPDIRS